MNRRAAALTIAAFCLLAIAALAWFRLTSPRPEAAVAGAPPSPAEPATPIAASVQVAWNAQIYFPGADGRLYSETRELSTADEPQAKLRALVDAVLSGPTNPDLAPAFPKGVAVDTALLAADGVAYVGLRSADLSTPPAAGSREEIARVYSLVDSIALNLEGAHRVTLLWNGSQLESFAGHLDTSRPLAADRSLLARPASPTP